MAAKRAKSTEATAEKGQIEAPTAEATAEDETVEATAEKKTPRKFSKFKRRV